MTDADFNSWLLRGGRPVVLVEVQTSPARYLSNVPYTTLPSDSPANRAYLPVIAGGVAFTESLPLDGQASLSAGDIALHNEDGALDVWLDDVWSNKSVQVFVGDIDWPRSEFRRVFSGLVSDLQSSSPQSLNIVLRDKLQKLNTPVSELLLGGTTQNKDRLQPITLGEVHNVEPMLVNPATHTYQCHVSNVERIIEVRADGIPRTVTGVANGKFSLAQAPVGTITASVQGATPYKNTVAGIVQVLATGYGNPAERLETADLDSTQLASFDSLHPQPVGVYLSDRNNVLQVCQDLASSVGSQVVMSREGKLRLLKLALPAPGPIAVVNPSDYEAQTLAITRRSVVLAGVRLGYCKNWTVQNSLDNGVPAEHKDLYAQEWLTVTSRDTATATTYGLYADPPQVDTLLLKRTDAEAEATRRLNLWKVQRTVYTFKGFAHLLTLELGQALTLYGSRFGLEAGKTGQVIGIQSDWIGRRVTVEVII